MQKIKEFWKSIKNYQKATIIGGVVSFLITLIGLIAVINYNEIPENPFYWLIFAAIYHIFFASPSYLIIIPLKNFFEINLILTQIFIIILSTILYSLIFGFIYIRYDKYHKTKNRFVSMILAVLPLIIIFILFWIIIFVLLSQIRM